MSYPRFRALLEAGLAWRTREQMQALAASAFPHMDEKGQGEMQESLRASLCALQGRMEEALDNTAALEAMRQQALLNKFLAGAGRPA